LTVHDFAEKINRIVGNQAGIIFEENANIGNDPKRRQPDIGRARNILGWEPRVDLDQGILLTIPYFKQRLGLA